MPLSGFGFTTSTLHNGERVGVPFADYHLYGGDDLNSEGATNHDGYAFTNVGNGVGRVTIKKAGYKDIDMPLTFPIQGTFDIRLEPSVAPFLTEALVIKGAYPHGPNPGAADNRVFMDELEQFSDADVTRLLDQYQGDGYESVTLGPAYGLGYHEQYGDTDWMSDPTRIIAIMRECKRRGLGITLAVLPDCPPYYWGTWDWEAVERDLTPLYSRPEFQQMVDVIQIEWEINTTNAEACKAGAYVARVFPHALVYYWHTPPGHSAPGLSSELQPTGPFPDEQAMWDTFEAAVKAVRPDAKVGWAMQDDSIYMQELTLEQKMENFANNVRVMMRHFPNIVKLAREYLAYAVYHWNWPVDGGPENWGTVARSNGSPNIGDGGPQ